MRTLKLGDKGDLFVFSLIVRSSTEGIIVGQNTSTGRNTEQRIVIMVETRYVSQPSDKKRGAACFYKCVVP